LANPNISSCAPKHASLECPPGGGEEPRPDPGPSEGARRAAARAGPSCSGGEGRRGPGGGEPSGHRRGARGAVQLRKQSIHLVPLSIFDSLSGLILYVELVVRRFAAADWL